MPHAAAVIGPEPDSRGGDAPRSNRRQAASSRAHAGLRPAPARARAGRPGARTSLSALLPPPALARWLALPPAALRRFPRSSPSFAEPPVRPPSARSSRLADPRLRREEARVGVVVARVFHLGNSRHFV